MPKRMMLEYVQFSGSRFSKVSQQQAFMQRELSLCIGCNDSHLHER